MEQPTKRNISRKSTSEKVKEELFRQSKKKIWLAEQLGVSRPFLDARLKDNCWSVGEVVKLQNLLGID
jgi:hypothetical protein